MTSMNTKLEVALAVGRPLIELEKHLDAAIALQAQAMTAAIEGRRKARLPLHAGQDGLDKLAEAQAGLLAVRRAVHAAHYDLRDVQDDMGLGVVAYGDHGDSPREFAPSRAAATPVLTVAA